MPDMAFGVLLLATGALGLGFGATVMALNTYAEAFFPKRADRAVLALNALLGLGTALAPVLVAIVVALGAWWLLPVVVACIAVLLFGVAYAQPLRIHAGNADADRPTSLNWIDLPRRFWLYAAAVFVYGIVETLNGNWAMLYLSSERGVSTQGASFALAAFWVMVTVGRVLIALISQAGAGALDLCRAPSAVAGGVSAGLAGTERSGWDHRFRPRRPGVLGISAVEHQLRGRGVSPALGRDGRRAHRVLSAGIRSRRVRDRPAARSVWALVLDSIRRRQRRRGADRRHRLDDHPTNPPAGGSGNVKSMCGTHGIWSSREQMTSNGVDSTDHPDFDGISRRGARPFRATGVARLSMNSHQPNVERAEALLKKKQERLREGQLAMAEYQADGRAVP